MTFYFYWIWFLATHFYTVNDVLRFTGYEVLATHYYIMNEVLLLLGMSLCNALLHYEWRFTFTGYESLQRIITLWMTFYVLLGKRPLQRIITLWMKLYLYWIWVFATHYYNMNEVLLILDMSLCNTLLHYGWHFTFYWVWSPCNAFLHYEWRFVFDSEYEVLSTHYYTMNGVIVLTGCESRNLSLFEIAQKLKNLEEFFRGKMNIKNSNYEIKVIDKIIGTRVGSVSRV